MLQMGGGRDRGREKALSAAEQHVSHAGGRTVVWKKGLSLMAFLLPSLKIKIVLPLLAKLCQVQVF